MRASAGKERKKLTAAQEGVWYAAQVDPGNPTLNIAGYGQLAGLLKTDLLEMAVRQASAEAEVFRLRFGHDDNGLWQMVDPDQALPFTVVDIRDEPEPLDQAEAWMLADAERPV